MTEPSVVEGNKVVKLSFSNKFSLIDGFLINMLSTHS